MDQAQLETDFKIFLTWRLIGMQEHGSKWHSAEH